MPSVFSRSSPPPVLAPASVIALTKASTDDRNLSGSFSAIVAVWDE